MTITSADLGTSTPDVRSWAAVLAVSLGIFLVVTAEQLPIGLLTQIADAMGVSPGLAGLTVTLPGIVAGLSAPMIALASGTRDRRIVLSALLGLLAVGSFVSAFGTSFASLLVSRFFVGFSIGGFWALAGGLAPKLVPDAHVPRATTLIFGGVAAAAVFGMPAGALIGEWLGWRTAFGVLGATSLALSVVLFLVLRPVPSARPIRLSTITQQARSAPIAAVLVVAMLVVTSQFAAYTYISPVAQSAMQVPTGWIGPLLLGYGLAGLVGNALAGIVGARDVPRTMLVLASALAVVSLAIVGIVRTPAAGIVAVLGWGLAFGGVSVTLQSWMLKVAKDEPEAGTSLLVCVFNLAIALGALVGGFVADRYGVLGVNVLGAALFASAIPAIVTGRRMLRRASLEDPTASQGAAR